MYSTATLENMDCLISERKNLMFFQFPTNSPICTLADCHIAKSSWIKLPSLSKLHEYKALTFFQVSLHRNWLIKTFDYLLLRIANFPGTELI